MSTSNVSITGNPATARRRPVVISDNKSGASIDLVENGPTGVVGHGKPTACNSKDLGRLSIGGDAKDLTAVRKSTGNSTFSPRSVRKGPHKPDKSRFVTVVSIFTKNFVLLIVVLGLVQLIRRLSVQSSGTNPVVFTDFEGRIAEVEGLLKRTFKMIQAKVDVVDKRMETEIGFLRSELSRKIDDKSANLESELKKLEARSDGLDSYLSELNGKEWLSKEEFDGFIEDLKKVKGDSGSSDGVSLDDVKAYARGVVMEEVEKHAADGLARGIMPWLLVGQLSGGIQLHTLLVGELIGFRRVAEMGVHGDAYKMLNPSFGEPGACFPLKGNSGFVEIRLRTAIIPEAVTLERVAKDCRVSGWFMGNTDPPATNVEKMSLLTDFTYDLEKSNAQTFNILDRTTAPGIIDTVRLDIASNHGSSTHSCIYRFRVHGREADFESFMAYHPEVTPFWSCDLPHALG